MEMLDGKKLFQVVLLDSCNGYYAGNCQINVVSVTQFYF